MAVYREPEICHNCGEPYKEIHAEHSQPFVGDTFIGWDYQGHVCLKVTPDTVEPTAKEGEDRYKNALLKINEIRNSIIGLQTINWSEHIYPLVAALDEAGIEGKGYPASREYFGTMLERTNKAEADLKEERSKAIQECIDSIEWEGPTIKRIIDELEKLKTKSI